ncbi:hypothetical protein [uncultured Ruminococcus sp.]|uniref:hypothetical protein n=1 Tax=uncultured Ruminococcus sp. TaxID=165186 RepID=UPI0025D54B6C|nr:hypothetical protein [uncultured Ruminococcus sp.]
MGLFKKKQAGTPLKEIMTYHGKRLSYVVERFGGDEEVIGRTGGISVDEANGKLTIVCDGKPVADLSLEGLICAELMSHNGADIKGKDHVTGKQRHIVAHYSARK